MSKPVSSKNVSLAGGGGGDDDPPKKQFAEDWIKEKMKQMNQNYPLEELEADALPDYVDMKEEIKKKKGGSGGAEEEEGAGRGGSGKKRGRGRGKKSK